MDTLNTKQRHKNRQVFLTLDVGIIDGLNVGNVCKVGVWLGVGIDVGLNVGNICKVGVWLNDGLPVGEDGCAELPDLVGPTVGEDVGVKSSTSATVYANIEPESVPLRSFFGAPTIRASLLTATAAPYSIPTVVEPFGFGGKTCSTRSQTPSFSFW